MDLNLTLGVEEEFLIVDAGTGELRSKAQRVLPEAKDVLGERVTAELNLSQIETGTRVCSSLGELRTELVHLRRDVAAAAEAVGCQVVAAGTHPSAHWQDQQINPTKDRYRLLEEEFQLTARKQLVCGSHVHVGIPDPDLAIQVLNRVRIWLSPLLALTANSPFWMGVDSGYASYRTQVWQQWPLTGMPEPLASRAAYDDLIEQLVAAGALRDASFLYWDVRPSVRYETLEFRIADSCLTLDESVMLAGLTRGLACTAAAEVIAGEPLQPVRGELVEVAKWRAGRFGLDDTLVDVEAGRSRPAAEVVASLLDHVRPALEELGDWEEVSSLVKRTLARGNGASRQREAFARAQSLGGVLGFLITETMAGVD
ncbi:MAG: carboxylate-amine ligase [Actinomycetota bacterium]|nr:carboxylate-amine ligase [Actinomycetota bacterium]